MCCFFSQITTDRIESYEYSNPQLYLSIIFFTALLFLLPTILIYYVVFASVSKEDFFEQSAQKNWKMF